MALADKVWELHILDRDEAVHNCHHNDQNQELTGNELFQNPNTEIMSHKRRKGKFQELLVSIKKLTVKH